jgi:hypothetical protein
MWSQVREFRHVMSEVLKGFSMIVYCPHSQRHRPRLPAHPLLISVAWYARHAASKIILQKMENVIVPQTVLRLFGYFHALFLYQPSSFLVKVHFAKLKDRRC